ncbi:MAG: alpha/beta fold hydrolase [Solirubrobacteraceae bacterium]
MTRSRFVERDALTLHALDFGGSGRDVLVLPGITSPAGVWEFVAAPLAREHRVCVLDLRGRGLSEAPADTTYTLADYAADTAAVIEAMELRWPILLGHSLGARIAAAAALARPDLVDGVILVDPPLSGPGRPPYPNPLAFYLDGIRAARAGDATERIRGEHPGWTEAQVRDRVRWLPTCDERAVAETYANFHSEDFTSLWDALAAPILIHGAASPVMPAEAVAELRARNPGARTIAVEGAGHMIPWDRPDGFLAAVRDATSAFDRGVVR